ncbi:carboxypeptidase-like regulatory domain-containing protein [Croceiramulus getboli]|nr:carboxypeptidase-like regulatory domain-containing protein [Flavobacteriaceae bacterium YJPT1-3]
MFRSFFSSSTVFIVLLSTLGSTSLQPVLAQSQTIQMEGVVTFQQEPLPDTNILIKGTTRGTQTDKKGRFALEAQVGDELIVSHVGFNDFKLILTQQSTRLSIDMDDYVESLGEVAVKAKRKRTDTLNFSKNFDIDLETSIGRINPKRINGPVKYMSGKELQKIASPLLEDALNRYAGMVRGGEKLIDKRYGITYKFDVDGFLYETAPPISYADVVHVFVIRAKGLVIVRTTKAPEIIALEKKRRAAKLLNKDFYNADARPLADGLSFSQQTATTPKKTLELQRIFGTIRYLGTPVVDVHIRTQDGGVQTKTDDNGFYELNAVAGDELHYSHVGFREVHLVVEEVTSRVDLQLVPAENELDEVVITVTRTDGTVLKDFQAKQTEFNTLRGNYDPEKAGFAIGQIDGSDISPIYSSLKEALVGKVSGYSINNTNGKAYLRGANGSLTQDYPVAWEVDGVFTNDEPLGLDLNQIQDIRVLKSLAATNRYGSMASGGVIVIKTKMGSFDASTSRAAVMAEKYRNNERYSNDARAIDPGYITANTRVEKLLALEDKEEAFAFYSVELKDQMEDYSSMIFLAQKFVTQHKDIALAREILMDLAQKHEANPEIQKAIAYHFQVLGMPREAITLYKNTAALRPQYAQSYRDLANAYVENEQFTRAWRTYMSYLMQESDLAGEGIGPMIYTEMEYLYFNRQNQTKFTETFVPQSKDINDFRNDVRMVFEWNTSEAEFDLEFVAPDLRVYTFEHTLQANPDLIYQEKTKGYSSKQFNIVDLEKGSWLVNITYHGNKKLDPTYLKVTTYTDWGQPQQLRSVQVYRLKETGQKYQLLRFEGASASKSDLLRQ